MRGELTTHKPDEAPSKYYQLVLGVTHQVYMIVNLFLILRRGITCGLCSNKYEVQLAELLRWNKDVTARLV